VGVRVHPIDGASNTGRVCEAGELWLKRRRPADFLRWRRSATEGQDSADERHRQLLAGIRLEDVRDGVKVLLLEIQAHGVPCMPVGIGDEVRVLIVGGHVRMFGARSDTWTRVDLSSSDRNLSRITVVAVLSLGVFSRDFLPQTLRRLEPIFFAEKASLAIPLRVSGDA